MFRRLEIPTPFRVGDVNAYLAGRTLVDPGPDSEEAWAAMLSALETEELAPVDISRVLVTHPHPDHFGLAHRFRAEGAAVLASPAAAEIVSDFRGRYEYERDYFAECFPRHGMAEKTARSVTELPEAYLEYAPDVAVDRELQDGDAVVVDDSEVDVLAVEGHAPGELVFAYVAGDERQAPGDERQVPDDEHEAPDDEHEARHRERHALVGDHVLATITPNPLLQPPAEPDGERPRVLPRYNASLERLREEPLDLLRTGHREDVDDPGSRIDEILAAHEQRTTAVLALVDGPTTAVEVMDGLFGDLPLTEYFPGMSEALGHLDVLEERGQVTRSERGGIVVYE